MPLDSEPLSAVEVHQLVRHILRAGRYILPRHARERCEERNMSEIDCINVARGSLDIVGEFHGTAKGWRYTISTQAMGVVVKFPSADSMVVITAWRTS